MDQAHEVIKTGSEIIDTYGLFWGLAVIAVGYRALLVGIALRDPKDGAFAAVREELRGDRWTGIYHRALERWFLNPLTRWCGDAGVLGTVRAGGWLARNFGVQPWSGGALEFSLRLAIVYPLLIVLVGWLVSGQARLGGLIVLPEMDWMTRAGFITVLVFEIFAFAKTIAADGRAWFPWVWIAVPILFLAASFVGFDDASTLAVIPISTIAFVMASAAVFASAIVGATSALITGVAVGAIAAAVSVHFAVLVTFAGVTALALGSLLDKCDSDFAYRNLWLGWLGLMLGVIGLALFYLPAWVGDAENLALAFVLLTWLALLPLLNGLWDWMSLGFTRGLLAGIRLGKHRGITPLFWGLSDFMIAMVFLGGIVATVVVVLTLANRLSIGGGGPRIVDLGKLFAELRTDAANPAYWWIYFMLLSTLLPTLIHLLLVGVSVVQSLSQWGWLHVWRETAARELDTNAVHRFNAGLYLTLVPMSGLILPMAVMWGLYQLLTAHGGWLGLTLLDWAEAVARWAGDL